MAQIVWYPEGATSPEPVDKTNPFPTSVENEPYVKGHLYKSPIIKVQGIGAAAAYAAGDAFGTILTIPVPKEGTIASVVFMDYDDEGITKEFVLFDQAFTATADNSAFAVTDVDLRKLVGVVEMVDFYDYNVNRVGMATPALAYSAPEGVLYAQLVTRGADNIAAGASPDFFVVVV